MKKTLKLIVIFTIGLLFTYIITSPVLSAISSPDYKEDKIACSEGYHIKLTGIYYYRYGLSKKAWCGNEPSSCHKENVFPIFLIVIYLLLFRYIYIGIYGKIRYRLEKYKNKFDEKKDLSFTKKINRGLLGLVISFVIFKPLYTYDLYVQGYLFNIFFIYFLIGLLGKISYFKNSLPNNIIKLSNKRMIIGFCLISILFIIDFIIYKFLT